MKINGKNRVVSCYCYNLFLFPDSLENPKPSPKILMLAMHNFFLLTEDQVSAEASNLRF